MLYQGTKEWGCSMEPKVLIEAWATVQSKGGRPSAVERHEDKELSATLGEISKKWDFRQPDSEFSIMTAKGEIVYVGQYEEGVVLRFKEDKNQRVFLTKDMAAKLGKRLLGKSP